MMNNQMIIKNYLKEKLHLNEYRCEQECQGIHRYDDIEQEFVDYILNKWNEDQLIEVEGFTAKILHEEYPLSILGAYNYLIYLREKPQEALENLKKGLPRW